MPLKRTLLTELPEKLPEVIRDFMGDAPVYDSSCSPQARVYYVERDGGYFVKTSAPGTLQREATLASYFHGKGLGAEVLESFTGESDWMITARVKGEDCTHGVYLEDPRRLCDLLGETLRRLHEIDPADCPVQDRNLSYLALAEENYRTGNYDSSHFPDSFGYASAEQAHRVLMEEGGRLAGRVLLHGD